MALQKSVNFLLIFQDSLECRARNGDYFCKHLCALLLSLVCIRFYPEKPPAWLKIPMASGYPSRMLKNLPHFPNWQAHLQSFVKEACLRGKKVYHLGEKPSAGKLSSVKTKDCPIVPVSRKKRGHSADFMKETDAYMIPKAPKRAMRSSARTTINSKSSHAKLLVAPFKGFGLAETKNMIRRDYPDLFKSIVFTSTKSALKQLEEHLAQS